jgi:hypothetical protein
MRRRLGRLLVRVGYWISREEYAEALERETVRRALRGDETCRLFLLKATENN